MVPVPFDQTSTWGKGADKGPQAIFLASEHLEGLDLETNIEVFRQGIYTDLPVLADNPEQMVQAVDERVTYWLSSDKMVVVIGGEHSVSIGSVQAHCKVWPDLTVLQLDAHADLRQAYKGSIYNHACVISRIRQLCPVVQVGIRSMDLEELRQYGTEHIIFAHQSQRLQYWIEDVIRLLGQKVYITIDLDVFDCSIMPSTGTPEPGGLDWYQVTSLLAEVCKARDVVGFDVVELCPIQGLRGPDYLAAKLIYKLLAYRFSSGRH